VEQNQKLSELLQNYRNVSEQLSAALVKQKDEFVRDSAILRFELCFELFWKILRQFALTKGVVVNSPKDSVRSAFRLGAIEEDAIYLEMIETRNLLVHTYEMDYAEKIYVLLPEYLQSMNTAVSKLQEIL